MPNPEDFNPYNQNAMFATILERVSEVREEQRKQAESHQRETEALAERVTKLEGWSAYAKGAAAGIAAVSGIVSGIVVAIIGGIFGWFDPRH